MKPISFFYRSFFIVLWIGSMSVSGQEQIPRESRKAKDSISIVYDAVAEQLSITPPYYLNQDGIVDFTIKDINLFIYNVTIAERQNDIISDSRVSELTNSYLINPTDFNLTDLVFHINSIPNPGFKSTDNIKFREIQDSIQTLKHEQEENRKTLQEYELKVSELRLRIDEFKNLQRDTLLISRRLNQFEMNSANDSIQKIIVSLKESRQKNIIRIDLLNFDHPYIQDTTDFRNYTKKIKEIKNTNSIIEGNKIDLENQYNQQIMNDSSSNRGIDDLNKRIATYRQALSSLQRTIDFYQTLICIVHSPKKYQDIQSEKELLAIKIFAAKEPSEILDLCFQRLLDVDLRYSEFLDAYNTIKPRDQDLVKKELLIDVYNQIKAFHSQIKFSLFQSFFRHTIKLYNAINEQNFTLHYRIYLVSDNADIIKFSMKGEPVSTLSCGLAPKPILLEFIVTIKRGIKLDVSTGIFANVGLFDHSYHFVTENGVTKVVEDRNDNLFVPSIGVLMNCYKRTRANVKFGGCIGVSTSDAQRIKYHLGGSLLIGRSQRIIVNLGLVGGQVDYAADDFKPGMIVNIPSQDLPSEVPLKKPSPFRLGGFLGITFNLTGTKQKDFLSKITAY